MSCEPNKNGDYFSPEAKKKALENAPKLEMSFNHQEVDGWTKKLKTSWALEPNKPFVRRWSRIEIVEKKMLDPEFDPDTLDDEERKIVEEIIEGQFDEKKRKELDYQASFLEKYIYILHDRPVKIRGLEKYMLD